MFEPIGDIGALNKTGGMLPGDYIRKVVIPKLDKMGLIVHDSPRKLVHWRVIVGKDENLIKAFLLSWYKSEHFPHYWNLFYNKQDPKTQQVWVSVLNECLDNGWYWPKVVNDQLIFGSRYKPEERPSAPNDMGRISHAAGWDDEYDDFVHED